MVVLILVALLLIILIYKVVNAEKLPKEYCVLFCGSMGSGKTLMSTRCVKKATKRYIRANLIAKFLCFVFVPIRDKLKTKFKDVLDDCPLYSTIPMVFTNRVFIFFSVKVIAKPLLVEHLTGEKHLPENSIIYIGEFGKSIASQFDYDNPYVQVNLAMLISFCRHWFCGKYGQIVLDEQAPSCVAKEVRVRIGKCANLSNFRKYTLFGYGIGLTDVEYLDFTRDGETGVDDDVKTVAVESGTHAVQKLTKRKPYYMIFISPKLKKEYDSRAYKDIYYDGFTLVPPEEYIGLQTSYLPLMPFNERDTKEYKKDRRLYRLKYSHILKCSDKDAPQRGESE